MVHDVPEDGVRQSQDRVIAADEAKMLAAFEDSATAVQPQGGEPSSTGVSLSQKSGCHRTGGSYSFRANARQGTSRH
jgi:hypothetical protein